MTVESDPDIARLLKEHEVLSLWEERIVAKCLQGLGWTASQSVTYRDPLTDKYRELDVLARRAYRNKDDGRGFRLDLLIALKSLNQHHVVVLPAAADLLLDEVQYRPGRIFASSEWTIANFTMSPADVSTLRDEVARDMLPPLGVAALPRNVRIARPFREVRPKGTPRSLNDSVLFQTHRALDTAATAIKGDRLEQARWLVKEVSSSGLESSARYRAIVDLCAHVGRIAFGFHRLVLLKGGLHELRGSDSLVGLPGFRLSEMSVGAPRGWTDVAALESAETFLGNLTDAYDIDLSGKGFYPCSVDDVRIARASDAALVRCPLARFD